MKVSFILPIYNVEKYLSECVESILVQTYRDFEILLVDDGSPDNCPALCDEWARKDDRIKALHKPMVVCRMPVIMDWSMPKVITWFLWIVMTSG